VLLALDLEDAVAVRVEELEDGEELVRGDLPRGRGRRGVEDAVVEVRERVPRIDPEEHEPLAGKPERDAVVLLQEQVLVRHAAGHNTTSVVLRVHVRQGVK